ncbi:hypothetical protein [Rhodococcus xishaensis]|nr:hypothetical protein [Rhodococcus xishaensis]
MTDQGASGAKAYSTPLIVMPYYEVAGRGALRRSRLELTVLLEGSLK